MKKRQKRRGPEAMWAYVYKHRMREGLEYCRLCDAKEELTFDHIIPRCFGGTNAIENITILCRPCNHSKDNTFKTDLLDKHLVYPPEDANVKSAEELEYGDVIIQGKVIDVVPDPKNNLVVVNFEKTARDFRKNHLVVVLDKAA